MADTIVQALVTGIPAFVNGVLHMPGEAASLDLSTLGNKDEDAGKVVEVTSLGDKHVVGFAPLPATGEVIAVVPIAAVAPHAPEPTMPQGIPPGTITTPSGRLMAPTGEDEAALSAEIAPATASVQDGATTDTSTTRRGRGN